ncbi:MAG: VCBS repeat-containing protein [Verrucomicrobia bacterium]|nr:VCBS repeat-containing protein [Verrucomicrobiota bacterium]
MNAAGVLVLIQIFCEGFQVGRFAEHGNQLSGDGNASVPSPAQVTSQTLQRPLPGSSPTLFERMAGESTGIDLVHQFPENPTLEMLQDQRSGNGVCIGDYDLDGLPDIYIANYDRGNRLYRNLGQWRFEDVTRKAGVDGQRRWCGGVALVDIDNEGDLDLYVCVFNAPNLLYLNLGDGTFRESARSFRLDFSGASVTAAFGDYDRDGWLDAYLVTSRLSVGTAHRLPTSSKDAFQKGTIQATPDGKIRISPSHQELFAAISKGDGRSELIIAGQYDYLFRNLGDGRFHVVNTEAGISGNHIGLAAVWWDYNDDGFPDLYVSNDYKGPDQLYRNNGNGTFTDVTRTALPCVPWSSMGSDIADLNNDGLMDLFATDMAGSSHARRVLNYRDPGKDRWFLLLSDPPQYRRNCLFLNTGTEQFMEVAHLAGLDSTDWTWSPKFADLDNDGWVDLFVATGMSRDFINPDLQKREERSGGWIGGAVLREANFAFRNLGDLRFQDVSAAWGLDQTSASYGAAFGDLDRDGDLELVVANYGEPVSVYRNNSPPGNRVLLRLKGASSNTWGIGATVKAETKTGVQTHYLTLARGFMSANEPLAHFGLGANDKIDRLTIRWPSGSQQILRDLKANLFYTITEPSHEPRSNGRESAPFTGQSRLTPAATDQVPSARQNKSTPAPVEAKSASPISRPLLRRTQHLAGIRHRESPYDDFGRQPLLPFKLSQFGPGFAMGDADGDGQDDLYLGGAAGQSGQLFARGPGGSFRRVSQPAFEADRACEDMAAIFFEANGDGALDLYVASGSVEGEIGSPIFRDRLYLNDGKGQFRKAPDGALPDLRDSGSVVAAADFDRDGDLDLFVGSRSIPGRYPLLPFSRLLRNENGKFKEVTEELAPGLKQTGLVTSALWSDTDGDGWLDLLVTHDWGPIKLFRNQKGNLMDTTQDAGLSKLLGWWNGIAGRDLNGDGHIDYVVTNWGLNSSYRANRGQPLVLFAGTFSGGPEVQLLEASFEGGRLVPVRGRSLLGEVWPPILEKFPTFQSFAAASISDIIPATVLEKAPRVEVNTLESGVLLNDGRGGFQFNPLPRLAQAAPSFGLVLTELNGDGKADLYLVQNFSHPQLETGRVNGALSLLLFGNGDGSFSTIGPEQSGLVERGDARGLTTTDFSGDGWPDFVVGINDGEVLAFENAGSGEMKVVKVRLFGDQRNPGAIGARVSAILSDGSTQVAEVYAGGGYLSQSTNELTFGLGHTNQLRELSVRWPDGRHSVFTNQLNQAVLRLKQPKG